MHTEEEATLRIPDDFPVGAYPIYKRGATVTLKGTNLRGITGVGLGNVDLEGPFYPLEVISYKIDEITLKIPVDIPLTAYYNYVQFKTTATGNSVGYGYIRISD